MGCMLRGILVCALAIVSLVYCQDDIPDCSILTTDSFDAAVESKNNLIMFYAPWCGHCKRLKPTWNELCQKTNKDGSETSVAAVDCTVEQSLCQAHGVKGYPTIKLFKKGSKDAEKYTGGRDMASLEGYLLKALDPNYVEPAKVEIKVEPCELTAATNGLHELLDCNLDAAIKSDYSFIKFYAPWCGHCKRLAPTWDELAGSLETVDKVTVAKLDCTTQKASCEKFGVTGFPTLVLFKDGKMLEKYRGGRELEALTNFLDHKVNGTELKAATPSSKPAERKPAGKDGGKCPKPQMSDSGVWEVEDCNFDYQIGYSDAFVKFYAPWCGHCKRLAPAWEELGTAFKDNPAVRITKVDCTVNKAACEQHNVRGYPTLMYFRKGQLVTSYGGAREIDPLKQFVENQLSSAEAPSAGGAVEPKEVQAVGTVEQLAEMKKDIHSTLVIFFHATNTKHAEDHALFKKVVSERMFKDMTVADVDCGVAEALCKAEKAFSDDTTFLKFYMGGQEYSYNNKDTKSEQSIKKFVKESMKAGIKRAVAKDEL